MDGPASHLAMWPDLKVAHRPYYHEVIYVRYAHIVVLPVQAELAALFGGRGVPGEFDRS